MSNITKDHKKAFIYSISTAILVGTAKELIDSRKEGNYFDVNDLIYTAAGGVVASYTLDLMSHKKQKQLKKIKELDNYK